MLSLSLRGKPMMPKLHTHTPRGPADRAFDDLFPPSQEDSPERETTWRIEAVPQIESSQEDDENAPLAASVAPAVAPPPATAFPMFQRRGSLRDYLGN
jgi:hypothetical protein